MTEIPVWFLQKAFPIRVTGFSSKIVSVAERIVRGLLIIKEGLLTVERLEEFKYLASVLVAVVLGFVIGYERKLRYKEAGIRTHTIVCVGSALIMVISKYGFGDSAEADAARVAAQIVSGVGFLGAGIIVYRKQEIHGLTTAAGVWATAGVGMASGAELYIVAAGATVIIVSVQCLFHAKWKIFRTKKYYQIKIIFTNETGDGDKVKKIFHAERFNRLVIERNGDQIIYHATLNTDQEFSSLRLSEIMTSESYIRAIERCDND